jgi:hypothetical protein
MKDIIQKFLEDKKVAMVGASNNKDNFGRSLMMELRKKDYQVFPVNPKCDEVQGVKLRFHGQRTSPKTCRSIILAVPASLTDEIIEQCIGTHCEAGLDDPGRGQGGLHRPGPCALQGKRHRGGLWLLSHDVFRGRNA